jgi:hypothetical protein
MVTTLDTHEVLRTPAIPGRPVTDPADWKGPDLERNQRWKFILDSQELDQILSMARSVRRTIGDNPNGLLKLPASAFDFGSCFEKIRAIRHELKDGLGAALIRGLPMGDIDLLDAATIYWGIGRHLGAACSNNPEGDMLGHVTDLGKTQKDPNSRGYQTREEMAFHCDQSSIVGLFCVRTAKSGGVSKISSSVALYNEMLKRSPESVAVLSRLFCWTKHGEMNKGEAAYYESPVFNFLDNMLCTSFGPTHMRKGHALPETPDLTEEQEHAIALAKSIAEELHYAMQMQPGDMQFLNNSVVLHTRNEYEDWPDAARKRLLWRLWLIAPDVRPLTPYIKQWGVGIKLASTTERIVL